MDARTVSSRDRLLNAAKRLFAKQGYEQSATSAIARNAGTSESQLMRYFGGKVGLLEALFDDAWKHLNARVAKATAAAEDTREALLSSMQTVVSVLSRDPDLATLFMFEGRRRRGDDTRVRVSRGFLSFADKTRGLVRKAQSEGLIDSSLDPSAVTSAILGATEGMIRDRLLARGGTGRHFAEREIRVTLDRILSGLATPARARGARAARRRQARKRAVTRARRSRASR